jgi:Domain of unknown function (DUF4263)
MPILSNLTSRLLALEATTEFNVTDGNFGDLEVRGNGAFHYFYDTGSKRLIKTFVLRTGPRVDTLCDVALIKKGDRYTPRLTFWKKDKEVGRSEALTESELVAEGRTILIKARVDVGDCYDNFWKLINFLQTYKDIELPESEFRVTAIDELEIAHALEGHDKSSILTAVKAHLGGQITERDVQLLLGRRTALDRFNRLMTDVDYFKQMEQKLGVVGERVWQAFFEKESWIFGYGLTLVACEKFNDKKLEQYTSGANVFTGGGKRSDAVMRTKGFLQTLLFAEIKKHTTDLLMPRAYRDPDVYQVDAELSGAVSQVQKTAHKAIKDLEDLHRSHDPSGKFQFEISTVRPRQIVVIGSLAQLYDDGELNLEKMTSFELYRRDHQAVGIITFDELYERAKFIVESQESEPSD